MTEMRETKGREKESTAREVCVYILIQTHRFSFNIYVSESTFSHGPTKPK